MPSWYTKGLPQMDGSPSFCERAENYFLAVLILNRV